MGLPSLPDSNASGRGNAKESKHQHHKKTGFKDRKKERQKGAFRNESDFLNQWGGA